MRADAQQNLVEKARFTTADLDQAIELFRQPFPGIELSAHGDAAFALSYEQVGDVRFTVHRLQLTGSGAFDGSVDGGIGVGRVRSGRFDLRYGRQAIDTSAPYLRPDGRSHAEMQDAHLELISLDPDLFAVAAHTRLMGSGRTFRSLSVDAAMSHARGLLPAWSSTADLVMSLAHDEQAFSSPLIRAAMYELLVSGLLETFPITTETGPVQRRGVAPAALRRAFAFVDEHFAEPIDAAMIAEAAGVPVRTLYSAFRTETGMAPMQHVRRRRLAAARADLLATDPISGASVAAIARRWGFAHLPRFAAAYRHEYGEFPSETLSLSRTRIMPLT